MKPGLSLFYGGNAQGKTNLLEACYYLSSLTSPRAERDADLARWGQDGFSLSGRVEDRDVTHIKIDVAVKPSLRKTVRVDERTIRRQDLFGKMPCVYFSPDDLYVVKKGASLRRKYIDSLLTRSDGAYGRDLSRYESTLSRRNAALKRAYKSPSWRKTLQPLDRVLVDCGSSVLYRRLTLMEVLGPAIKEAYNFISGSKCDVSYCSSIGSLNVDKASIQEAFWAKLETVSSDELARGITLVGPHRDDLDITFDGKTFRYFGSQGQQRSVALALRMAEAGSLESSLGRRPILLLDDVLSELDEGKRERVMAFCDLGHQVLITATDPVLGLPRSYSLFHVSKDTVIAQ